MALFISAHTIDVPTNHLECHPCTFNESTILLDLGRPRHHWGCGAYTAHYPVHLLWVFVAGLATCVLLMWDEDTEIDWETYMVQVAVHLKGERDYSKISGPTGPLV